MKTVRRFRKTKIVVAIVYLLVLAVYAFFLFSSFLPSQHQEDMNLFGKSVYVLENGEAVGVDFSRQPQQGDKIVCVANGKKYQATVDQVTEANSLTLSVDMGDHVGTFTTSSSSGVITSSIPVLGAVYGFLHSTWGIVCIIIIPCAVFLVFEIVQLSFMTRRKNEDEQDSDPVALTLPSLKEEEPPMPAISPTREVKKQWAQAQKGQTQFDTVYPPIHKHVEGVSFDDTLKELKYKMAFQDTHEVSNKVEEVIEEDNEQLEMLKKYGMSTVNIPDGVEVTIDPKSTAKLVLRLKNDGSLAITTDNYVANIDLDLS